MTKIPGHQIRFENTKKQILEAAMHLIQEKGAKNVSLREIARKTNYSPAAIYLYFENKQQIINAVQIHIEDIFTDLLILYPKGSTYTQILHNFGNAYFKFQSEYPEYFFLLFSKLDKTYSLKSGDYPPSYRLIIDTIMNAIEEGEFTITDEFTLEEIVFILWTQIHGIAIIQQNILKKEAVKWSNLYERIFDDLINRYLKT